jgi:hypothetical protein
MRVLQSSIFRRATKRLHPNQKQDLDEAIRAIMAEPMIGEEKVGDLAGVMVHKFKMAKQLTLLAYEWREADGVLFLLALGSHENFYRDLKR